MSGDGLIKGFRDRIGSKRCDGKGRAGGVPARVGILVVILGGVGIVLVAGED